MPASPAKGGACPAEELMRWDGWFAGRSLREPFEERNTSALSSRRGRGFPCCPRRGRESADDLTALPLACCRHYCRPTFGHIDCRASSRG
jgi:hypothetical protein